MRFLALALCFMFLVISIPVWSQEAPCVQPEIQVSPDVPKPGELCYFKARKFIFRDNRAIMDVTRILNGSDELYARMALRQLLIDSRITIVNPGDHCFVIDNIVGDLLLIALPNKHGLWLALAEWLEREVI